MARPAPFAQFHRKADLCRAGRVVVSRRPFLEMPSNLTGSRQNLNATFFDEMWVSCSNSKTERKSINCRIVFVVIPRAPVYRVVFKKKNSKFLTQKIHTIKCVMTELGRAGWEIFGSRSWHSDLCCARSVGHDLGPNIFPSCPPTQSISSQYLTTALNW